MQTVFCSRALTDCGFENASAKCGLDRLYSLSACSSLFTDARASIEPEASSCANGGMTGYGMSVVEAKSRPCRLQTLLSFLIRSRRLHGFAAQPLDPGGTSRD